MKNAQMQVICFDQNDIITTSNELDPCLVTSRLINVTDCAYNNENKRYMITGKVYTYNEQNQTWSLITTGNGGVGNITNGTYSSSTEVQLGWYHSSLNGAMCTNPGSHTINQ